MIGPDGGKLELQGDGSTAVVIEANRQVASDQAARAARCALAIQELVKRRSLAIAMGQADLGTRRPEAAVIERAARLLAQAAPTRESGPAIAIDEMVAGLLDVRFDVVERDAGLRLAGERVLMQGTRTLLGRVTPYVGRDWELGSLGSLLDECVDERRARGAVVIAPAGMGKSRLAVELVRRAHERRPDVAIWIGRGDSLRAGSTLDLLAQALRGALGIRGGEPLAARQERIRARVAEHVPATEQRRVTKFLAELVGAPLPGDGEDGAALRAARQDAQLMSEQMRRAWLDFLEAVERLLERSDDGQVEPLSNAAASRASYAAYQAVADCAQQAGLSFDSREPRYYRHDTLPDRARRRGLLDEDSTDDLSRLRDLRVKADYCEDMVEYDEASEAQAMARGIVTSLLEREGA